MVPKCIFVCFGFVYLYNFASFHLTNIISQRRVITKHITKKAKSIEGMEQKCVLLLVSHIKYKYKTVLLCNSCKKDAYKLSGV